MAGTNRYAFNQPASNPQQLRCPTGAGVAGSILSRQGRRPRTAIPPAGLAKWVYNYFRYGAAEFQMR
jgi:hypothetical protein